MRILTEASGSLTSAYLLKAIKEAGHTTMSSDINTLNAAYCIADDFIQFPKKDNPNLWEYVENLIIEFKIDVVIPSLDEMLMGWAKRKELFAKKNIHVIISPLETIETFQDKWKTYLFFSRNNIPCPKTSLAQDYELVKPRFGRGSTGVRILREKIPMDGLISQEVVKGEEHTIDTFFDYQGKSVYIVSRKRVEVKDGKSTKAIVVKNTKIETYIQEMAQYITFIGPINFQCFIDGDRISLIEVNPRIAGGMALGFAATENWIPLIINNLIYNKPITPKSVKYNLKMVRYYAECFIP